MKIPPYSEVELIVAYLMPYIALRDINPWRDASDRYFNPTAILKEHNVILDTNLGFWFEEIDDPAFERGQIYYDTTDAMWVWWFSIPCDVWLKHCEGFNWDPYDERTLNIFISIWRKRKT